MTRHLCTRVHTIWFCCEHYSTGVLDMGAAYGTTLTYASESACLEHALDDNPYTNRSLFSSEFALNY